MLHREISAYTSTCRIPAVYLYLNDFSIMSNWNIVCSTNIHYLLKYGYVILKNNIYTKNTGDRCVTGSYLYLFAAVYNYNANIQHVIQR